MGLDSYCCYFWVFKEWVCWRALYYFSFSSLYFLALGHCTFYITATVPLYIGLSLWDFSLLPLRLTNHFCLVTRPPLTLGMPSTFYPFHYLFHDKFQFIWFYCDPFSLPWTNKSMSLSLPTSLAYIKWSQPSTTHFGKNAILVRHFPKKGPGWKSKIGFFLLPSNYTLCKSLDRPTSHALTRYWLMVLRPQHGFSTTLCFLLFFFSFPHRFYHSTLFHFTPCSFCPCLSFMEGWHGLLELNILLSFHGPVGLLAAISCRACLLGLVPFFLSFQAFAARYSYFVSLLSFLVPVAYVLLFQTRLAYCALSFFLFLFFFPGFCGPFFLCLWACLQPFPMS